MSHSLKELLKTGAPLPKIALLPDECFFVRSVPIEVGASSAAANSQVELALETLSPFPVAQLLHASCWLAGQTRALAFAAYRRRFDSDEVSSWSGLDWVVPTFCTLLGYKAKPGTLALYPTATGLTGIHWDSEGLPDLVLVRPVPESADVAVRASLREEIVKAVGGCLHLVELSGAPEAVQSGDATHYRFKVGELLIDLDVEMSKSLDVRPKEALALLERARRRDLFLWRSVLSLALLLVLLGLGELGLFVGKYLLKGRQDLAVGQRELVARIMTSHQLASRIEELATRRLLPFEMLTIVSEKKPVSIQFLSTTTSGLYSMKVEAQTNSPSEISPYQQALGANPAVARVEVQEPRARDRMTTFTLIVNFKPEMLVPATP